MTLHQSEDQTMNYHQAKWIRAVIRSGPTQLDSFSGFLSDGSAV